jgi:drug/metabolite transporter (DMT)-like permease
MKQGYIYIALATILFSTMEVALKLLSGQFNPMQMNFLRFFIGSIILLPIAIKNLKKRHLILNKGDFKFFMLTGFICVVVSMSFYQLSILYSKASIVAILFSCNPIFIIPFAYFMLGEKVYKHTIVSLIISLIGLVFILNPFKLTASILGIVLTFLSAAFFALYGVISTKKSSRYGGIVCSCFSFLIGSAEMLILILITKIPVISSSLTNAGYKTFANIPIIKGITLSTMPSLIFIGVFITGLGYSFYFLSMEITSAATASIVFYIKPALAPVLSFIFLKEAMGVNTFIGIAFILLSSCITFFFNIRMSKAIHSEEEYKDEESVII